MVRILWGSKLAQHDPYVVCYRAAMFVRTSTKQRYTLQRPEKERTSVSYAGACVSSMERVWKWSILNRPGWIL